MKGQENERAMNASVEQKDKRRRHKKIATCIHLEKKKISNRICRF